MTTATQTPPELTTVEDQPSAFLAWLDRWIGWLPEIGPDLSQLITYSKRGEWTEEPEWAKEGAGWRRKWHLRWTYAVAVPVAAAALYVKWALALPLRAGFAAVFVLVAGTAVAQVPVVGWLVPNLINITAWWH